MKFTNKTLWRVQEGLVVGLWIFLLILAIIKIIFWPLLVLLGLHGLELLLLGKMIRRSTQYTTSRIIIYCLFFGYTWWIPVKKGIFQPKKLS
ncbi:hypothetical protein [Candidatus Lokiarchaeum ossiferum]|uniref:hypothetical protein n=1 Tax=Candidatus Lokiarchaeum ossiferum TaxID=2951803 RepID=UPI00352C35C6